ncbi:Neuropeptide SIFamide receptor [Gryllus bimaculatus]|nr:Neuropeptide SIFamide receptor [Gryllus bimaculatus]
MLTPPRRARTPAGASERPRLPPPPPRANASLLASPPATPAADLCSPRPEDVLWDDPSLLASLAVLAVINVMVIVGNCLVIAAVFMSSKLRSVTNLFIVSLAVADLMVGVAVLPFSATWEVFKTPTASRPTNLAAPGRSRGAGDRRQMGNRWFGRRGGAHLPNRLAPPPGPRLCLRGAARPANEGREDDAASSPLRRHAR